MKVVIFRWDVRDKPPFFGYRKTWVYTGKFKANHIDKKIIDKIMKKVDEKYGCDLYKIVIYFRNGVKKQILLHKRKLLFLFPEFYEVSDIVLR